MRNKDYCSVALFVCGQMWLAVALLADKNAWIAFTAGLASLVFSFLTDRDK